jgi:hypothetical protein
MRDVRMAVLLFATLVNLAGVDAKPAAAPAADPTVVDHDNVAFELPGRWQEKLLEDGYELKRGDDEQVIVGVYPPLDGLDGTATAEKLASLQRNAMEQQCKRGAAGQDRARDPAVPRVIPVSRHV